MGFKLWFKEKLGLIYPSDVLVDKPHRFIDYEAEIEPLKKAYKQALDKTDKNENVHDVHDVVNKPKHYHQGGFDAIYVIKQKFSLETLRGFFIGNIIKYILRFEHKNGVEDLKKARFYLDKLIEIEEQRTPDPN